MADVDLADVEARLIDLINLPATLPDGRTLVLRTASRDGERVFWVEETKAKPA